MRELQNIIERNRRTGNRASGRHPRSRPSNLETTRFAGRRIGERRRKDLAGQTAGEISKASVILSAPSSSSRDIRIKTASGWALVCRTLGMKLKRWKEDGELVEDLPDHVHALVSLPKGLRMTTRFVGSALRTVSSVVAIRGPRCGPYKMFESKCNSAHRPSPHPLSPEIREMEQELSICALSCGRLRAVRSCQ